MFKINKKINILFIIIGIICLLAVPVLAEDFGLEATRSAAGLESGSIPDIIGNMIGALLSMVGVLFFALMLYGGILWMVARGNQEQEKKALNTITGAIIGIIIVVSSYAITNFVFKGVRGENTTTSPAASIECAGKTGSQAGCDTCVATKDADWLCRAVADCSTVNGEKVSGLCMAPGQEGDGIKCCKAKQGGVMSCKGKTDPDFDDQCGVNEVESKCVESDCEWK